MLLRRFTLRTRFFLVMGFVTLSLLTLGAWGVVANHVGIVRVEALFDRAQQSTDGIGQLKEGIAETRRLQAQMLSTTNTLEVERLFGLWQAAAAGVGQSAQALAKAEGASAEVAALAQRQGQELAAYLAALGPIGEKLKGAQIDNAAAVAYAEREEPKALALVKTSRELAQALQATQAGIRQEMAAAATFVSNLRLVLVAFTLVVVLPLLWLTLRSVLVPLHQAQTLAARIASGDLSDDSEVQGRDETAALLRALQAMQSGLRGLVGQVRQAAESIQVASTEVAVGNQDLSQRTEVTAGNLQATASSIEQLHGAVSHSAESASQATQLAAGASQVAERGGAVVAQVVATMDEISASSRRIADIIGTIDGIAFQTNILALNAAVEAARAGEQGRGFAVVASEVRSLAQRSAEAAREIKSLIGASVESVETGARLVQDAGSTMTDIVASVQRVTDIIGEISHATGEQRGGIGQVNQSVAQLDQMTQQNAALVEQSAAAAESLKQQAATLTGLVSTFRLRAEAA